MSSNSSASLIDHIWTTQFEHRIGNFIIVADITEHYPTTSQFNIELSKSEPQYIYKRLTNTVSLSNFNDDLSRANWQYILNSTCPSDAFSSFNDIFCKLLDECFPIKQMCIHRKHDISPYITSALKTSIKEKHRLERLAKKWPLTYGETYKQFRNKLTYLLRTANNTYYKNQQKNNQGISKRLWKAINSL